MWEGWSSSLAKLVGDRMVFGICGQPRLVDQPGVSCDSNLQACVSTFYRMSCKVVDL